MSTALASYQPTIQVPRTLSENELSKTSVLVVDDSSVIRLLVGRMVEKEGGLRPLFATNGVEALAAMERELPGLVLTDMQMPEMDGLELVREIRMNHPLVPVILMTAHGSEELAVQALQMGAASYVPKNSMKEKLVDTIQCVLEAAANARQKDYVLSCLTHAELQFSLDNYLANVSPIVAVIQEYLGRMRLCDETDSIRTGVAIEESLVNAMFHGNLEVSSELRQNGEEAFYELAVERRKQMPYCNRRIHVTVTLTRSESVFTIRDDGPGFDPSKLPDPTDPSNLERIGGRGLLLIRTFMDEVTFNSTGNEITLIKRRAA